MRREFLFLAICYSSFCTELLSVPLVPEQNFCPVVIVNNTSLPANQVYFVAYGLDPCGTPCFLAPSSTPSPAPYTYLTNSPTPSSLNTSVKLSDLSTVTIPGTPLGLPNNTTGYLWYMPTCSSCRGFFSLNQPMYLSTSFNPARGLYDINSPSPSAFNDPNTYTFYQDMEFGLVTFGSEIAAKHLYLNLSYVDYFCLPMTLGLFSCTDSAPIVQTSLYSSGFDINTTRGAIITQTVNALTTADSTVSPPLSHCWSSLAIPNYTNPYTDTTPASYLRILAAKNSLDLGTSGTYFKAGAATPHFFPENYISGFTSPAFLTETLYNYYNNNTLYFQILPADSNQIWITYSMISTTFSGKKVLQFSHQAGTTTVPTPFYLYLEGSQALITKQLLSGGNWILYDGTNAAIDQAYTNEIAKMLSALFTTGTLPWTPTTSILSPLIVTNIGNGPEPSKFATFGTYQYFPTRTTPWYNAYDAILHPQFISKGNVGSIPPYTSLNPTLGQAYAYDYDDLLTMSGLTPGTDIQDNLGQSLSPAPYALIVLNSVANSLPPNPSQDSYQYNVTATPAVNGVTITYLYYLSSSGAQQSFIASTPGQSAHVLGNVYVDATHPFQIRFTFNNINYTYNINLQKQLTTYDYSSSTAYGFSEQYFQEGITFGVVNTSGTPAFTISVNSTPPPWAG